MRPMRELARVVTAWLRATNSVKFVAASTPAPAVNPWQLARLVVVAGTADGRGGLCRPMHPLEMEARQAGGYIRCCALQAHAPV